MNVVPLENEDMESDQINSVTAVPCRRVHEHRVSVHSTLHCSSTSDISTRSLSVPTTGHLDDYQSSQWPVQRKYEGEIPSVQCTDEMPPLHFGQDISSAPRTESTAIDCNDDSLDASDFVFSQELIPSPGSSGASGHDTESTSNFKTKISNA